MLKFAIFVIMSWNTSKHVYTFLQNRHKYAYNDYIQT